MGLFNRKKQKTNEKKHKIEIRTIVPSRLEIEAQMKKRGKETVQNFLKDSAGLYPHEILLLSYYEKYFSGKPIARFWEFEFGIDNVPELMRSLENRGFAKNGKLTELGEKEVEQGAYVIYIHRHKNFNISLSDLSILINKHPNMKYRDLIWGEFNRQSGQYFEQRQFGLYRNTRYSMYQFLMEEKRYQHALRFLAEVVFYDLNGSDAPLLPPGIINNIRSISRKLDESDEMMIDYLQQEYSGFYAPVRNFSNDEVACIFTAYAFGHDEMAEQILHKMPK